MSQPRGRLILIDLMRSLALLGMVIYHFTYDLDMFGFLPRGTAVTGFFWWFARLVAGSFIFLAGVGLWLAHGRGIRWASFWKREARIVAAALLVTLVSSQAMPGMTIFYGILHSIAVSSLVGLLFLRLPAGLLLALAAAVLALPWHYANPALDGPLVWIGLSGRVPLTADYQPFFPWFAPFLAGLATAKILSRRGLWADLQLPETPLLRALAWPGKHSLPIYLLHQPLLIALLLGYLRLVPPG